MPLGHPHRLSVVIFGSRGWNDRESIRQELVKLPKKALIVEGDASGADLLSGEEAKAMGFDVQPCPAEWRKHDDFGGWCVPPGSCQVPHKAYTWTEGEKLYCKRAGFRRNQMMLDEYHPWKALCFAQPGPCQIDQLYQWYGGLVLKYGITPGSADMLERCILAKVPVRVIFPKHMR